MVGLIRAVPTWLWVGIVALLAVGVQQVRIERLSATLAAVRADAAVVEAARQAELRRHAEEKLALIAKHNASIQTAEKNHAEKLAAAEVRARADAATVGRLRNQIADYARRGGTCSVAAAESDGGKSAAEVLGGLLAESLELLAEGRALHELRDAEMSLLFDQIDADRAACSKVSPGDAASYRADGRVVDRKLRGDLDVGLAE